MLKEAAELRTPTSEQLLKSQAENLITFSNQPTPNKSTLQNAHENLKSSFSKSKNSHNFASLSEKNKIEAYYDLYDKNLELKKKQNELEDRIKRLVTQLTRITSDVKYERDLLANANGADFRSKIEDLEKRNEKLMDENSDLKARFRETSNKKQPRQPSARTVRLSGNQQQIIQPGIIEIKKTLEKAISQRDEIIVKLRDQLKQSEDAISQLIQQKSTSQPKTEKLFTLTDVEYKIENLTESYEAQQTYSEVLTNMLEEAQNLLVEEQKKNFELEIRVKQLEPMRIREEYEAKIQELVKEVIQLEDKIKELCQTPLIRDIAEMGLTQRTYNIFETELREKHKVISENKATINSLQSEITKYGELLRLMTLERNKLREENLILTHNLQERSKYVQDFESKLILLARDSDSDAFMRALGLLKIGLNGKEWPVVDSYEENRKLKQDLEILTIEKGELAAELEKSRKLLKLKESIENDKIALVCNENEKLNMLLKASQKRIDELSKLAQYRSNLINNPERPIISNVKVEPYDVCSGFIDGDTVIDITQNLFDLLIIDAEFNPHSLPKNIVNSDFATFLTVDFYDHESQISSICPGLSPQYDIHMSFVVEIDHLSMTYFHEGKAIIDVHISQGDKYLTIARCEILLNGLIEASKPESLSKIIQSTAVLYSAFDDKIIGYLRYKMKMRQPLNELYTVDYEDSPENSETKNESNSSAQKMIE